MRPITPRAERLRLLYAQLDRIADEIAVLRRSELEDATAVPGPNLKPLVCGSEQAYQRHRHYGEDCATCKAAHATVARLKAARKKAS